MKIGLGTVQFGMKYGILNNDGVPENNEIRKIINIAKKNKVKHIDTASLYGNSESTLGDILNLDANFSIITKTCKFDGEKITSSDVARMKKTFFNSLEKLKATKVYGLLIHRSSDLLKNNAELLFDEISILKEKKLIQKVGISSYDKNEINEIISKYSLDLIQVPVNIFNQTMLKNGFLKKLKKKKIEIHARSIFLQGAFFATQNNILSDLKSHIYDLNIELRRRNLSILDASISFVNSIKEIDVGLFGVLNSLQFEEILNSFKKKKNFNLDFLDKFAIENENLINPAKWKR